MKVQTISEFVITQSDSIFSNILYVITAYYVKKLYVNITKLYNLSNKDNNSTIS